MHPKELPRGQSLSYSRVYPIVQDRLWEALSQTWPLTSRTTGNACAPLWPSVPNSKLYTSIVFHGDHWAQRNSAKGCRWYHQSSGQDLTQSCPPCEPTKFNAHFVRLRQNKWSLLWPILRVNTVQRHIRPNICTNYRRPPANDHANPTFCWRTNPEDQFWCSQQHPSASVQRPNSNSKKVTTNTLRTPICKKRTTAQKQPSLFPS